MQYQGRSKGSSRGGMRKLGLPLVIDGVEGSIGCRK